MPYRYSYSVYHCRWFFGHITRADAEKQLKKPFNGSGSFLLRDSTTFSGDFALDVRHDDHIDHYHIERKSSGMVFIIERKVFATVVELISVLSAGDRWPSMLAHISLPAFREAKQRHWFFI